MLRDPKLKDALLTAAMFIVAAGAAVLAVSLHRRGITIALVAMVALFAAAVSAAAIRNFFFRLPRETGHDNLVLAILMAALTVWAVCDAEYLKSIAWAGLTAANAFIFVRRAHRSDRPQGATP